jgi:CheY-like chemotaxis protein
MSIRILLVDDEELNRDLLKRRLERRGFDVLVAIDGADACRQAREQLPDLVLMDMSMPVMDGMEAARALKREERTRAIPIIGLTALAMPGDRERVLAAGCDDYETKPIEFNRLLEKIQARLAHKANPSGGQVPQ